MNEAHLYGLTNIGTDVITWKNEDEFWCAAARSAPWHFRLLRRTLAKDQVETQVGYFPEWAELKKRLEPGDLFWPFEFNARSLSYRKGIVAVRCGKGIGGVVLVLS